MRCQTTTIPPPPRKHTGECEGRKLSWLLLWPSLLWLLFLAPSLLFCLNCLALALLSARPDTTASSSCRKQQPPSHIRSPLRARGRPGILCPPSTQPLLPSSEPLPPGSQAMPLHACPAPSSALLPPPGRGWAVQLSPPGWAIAGEEDGGGGVSVGGNARAHPGEQPGGLSSVSCRRFGPTWRVASVCLWSGTPQGGLPPELGGSCC